MDAYTNGEIIKMPLEDDKVKQKPKEKKKKKE